MTPMLVTLALMLVLVAGDIMTHAPAMVHVPVLLWGLS